MAEKQPHPEAGGGVLNGVASKRNDFMITKSNELHRTVRPAAIKKPIDPDLPSCWSSVQSDEAIPSQAHLSSDQYLILR